VLHTTLALLATALAAQPLVETLLEEVRVYDRLMLLAAAHVAALGGPLMVMDSAWLTPTTAVALLLEPHVPSVLLKVTLKPEAGQPPSGALHVAAMVPSPVM
jgi:hypothetical protein